MKTLENGRVYVEIGETFTAEDGRTLRCEIDTGCCESCHFDAFPSLPCHEYACTTAERDTSVVFVPVQ